MQRGYVKLWRKSIDGGWLSNHKLWAFWCWCLMKASHKEFDLVVGYTQVHLMPGEFVFGLRKAAKELKISIQSIRTILDFLKTSQNLTLKSTHLFSIITITNWDIYQSQENEINTPINTRVTHGQHTGNNKQEHKNIRTKETNIGDLVLPQNIKPETWSAYLEMRKTIKKPATIYAQKLIIGKLAKMRDDPNKVLEQSISNSYQGVFPLKEELNARTTTNFRDKRPAVCVEQDKLADDINAEYYRRKALETANNPTGNT
jgi:hypothetical protein